MSRPTAEASNPDSLKACISSLKVRTSSVANPASYAMRTGSFFPGKKYPKPSLSMRGATPSLNKYMTSRRVRGQSYFNMSPCNDCRELPLTVEKYSILPVLQFIRLRIKISLLFNVWRSSHHTAVRNISLNSGLKLGFMGCYI